MIELKEIHFSDNNLETRIQVSIAMQGLLNTGWSFHHMYSIKPCLAGKSIISGVIVFSKGNEENMTHFFPTLVGDPARWSDTQHSPPVLV